MQAILCRRRDPGLALAVERDRLCSVVAVAAGGQPFDADAAERNPGADRAGRQQPPPGEPAAHCPATTAPTSESGSASASIERLRPRVSAFVSAV